MRKGSLCSILSPNYLQFCPVQVTINSKKGRMGRKTGRGKTGQAESRGSVPHDLWTPTLWFRPVALTCCLGGLVTKQPGLAAWYGLEPSILWGWRQALGSASQECVKVLQPCYLEGERTEK